MLMIFLTALALVWLVFAIVSDLRTREIPNWLNFSLIIFALGIRFFDSLFNANWNFFMQGVFGFVVFFILANILYYGRFFAGGDAKLLMALGPIIPFNIDYVSNVNLFSVFLFLFFLSGAIYGIIVLLLMSIKNFLKIKRDFAKQIKNNKKIIIMSLVLSIILLISAYFYSLLAILAILIFISPYLVIYTKIVDNVCMVARVKTSQLTEGDWLYKDIKVGGKIMKAKWEGLSKKEIKILKNKYKFVLIKRGIEFSPVFLISFLVYVYLYIIGINLWDSLW